MTFKTLIILTILLALYVWASSEDSYEEQREAAHYAEMVCDGYWPDYKNQKPECEK
jgi:hypothetical protein